MSGMEKGDRRLRVASRRWPTAGFGQKWAFADILRLFLYTPIRVGDHSRAPSYPFGSPRTCGANHLQGLLYVYTLDRREIRELNQEFTPIAATRHQHTTERPEAYQPVHSP